MKDIVLFTNRKITYDECFSLLSSKLKNVVKNGINRDEIMIGTKWRVYFEITDETLLTYPIPFEKEFIEKIPLEGDPCMTGFEFHRSIDAKRVIEALLPGFPELFVYVDTSDQWFGTGEEYLKAKFDY